MQFKSNVSRSLLALALLVPTLALGQAAAPAKPKPATAVKPAAANATVVVPEEEAVIKTYESMLPSVVSIVVSETITTNAGGSQKLDTGGGTGFFISQDGYILTNKHVVLDDKVDYTVITSDGREFTASVLAKDPLYDIAIVKVEGSGFTPAKLGDSDKIRVASTVLAIGNVLAEFQNTVTRGIVAGLGRTVTASGSGITETIEGAIQTDASINPGNSGGPLVNLRGEVIGINSAINREGEALGFAIPINVAKQAVAKFRKNGKITRTLLGVRYITLNRSIARAAKVPVSQGAYVQVPNASGEPTVVPGGPADVAGVKPGDVILEVNGRKLAERFSLSAAISQYEPGVQVKLKVLRAGTELTLTATLAERT